MSTEVECGRVDSGLTAASSGAGAEGETQTKGSPSDAEAAHPQREPAEPGHRGSEKPPPGDGHGSEAARSPADSHKKCKENDKENDQSSSADSAVEAVKRKVVEAPPPKVNPWTKRTTGRVPINNITCSSQEKGERLLLFFVVFYLSCTEKQPF